MGESVEPAFERQKIKSILLLSTMCSIFALRESPYSHTKQTRITSVIYLQQTTDYLANGKRYNTHHIVFFNKKNGIRVPTHYPGETNSVSPRGDKWRPQNGTHGAAMRLKALHHAPLDNIKHPKTSRRLTTRQKETPYERVKGLGFKV